MKYVCLLILVVLAAGCGSDTAVGRATDPGPISSGVAHRNWGGYNLYRFGNGSWQQVVSQATQVGPSGDLGGTPVMVVHGLGSMIRTNTFNPLAQALLNSGASAVFGFEYDTLDSISTNGTFLVSAYQLLNQPTPGRVWRQVSHSMGSLVTRVAFESSLLPVAPTGNKAVLVAGPHF